MSYPTPLAIIGIGCRFPTDIDGFGAFRRALAAGRSMVRRVPPDRWDIDRFYHPDVRRRGHMHAVRGGFLDGIDQFDAAFFGIGPAEAARMDPQQRFALETAYRALEDAGWPLERVAGARIAAIYGVSARDYDAIQTTVEDRARIGAATNTGSAASIVANRVSYAFDLRGPSFAVDTACSSSLTALHLAARAIEAGDAEAALVGGVNLVLRPEPTIGFSQGGYLSPDGECRAFSDDANGYVRGEGAATVLVRPLADALRDGDRIWAILRATAINQDGHAAAMTAPSVEAQTDLLRTAYAQAGIDPGEVAYLEAHGTGTPVGDPIEATAIGTVLGASRREPLPIGSVKTVLGHLESAAGMAGLLKLAATLHDRTLYPNLCFRAPNPAIPFAELGIRVVLAPEALPERGTLFGGVNAFGFGGANGHAVLESPPARRGDGSQRSLQWNGRHLRSRRSGECLHIPLQGPQGGSAPVAVYFSARTASAARTLAGELARQALPDPRRLVAERSSLEHRVVVRGTDPMDLTDRLLRFGAGDDGAAAVARLRDAGRVGVAFVFGGQGPQWYGMARGLLGRDPTFGAAIDEISDALAGHGWLGGQPDALRRELGRDERTSRMSETRVAQPCLFAVQVGLARVLARHGIEPEAVTGHSIGELAAAHVAGCLELDEAARLVVARSEAQASAEGCGRMAALDARPDELGSLLSGLPGRVEVAAYNGPTLVTVAGDTDAVLVLGARTEREGRFFRLLDVSVPFHCHLMEPLEGPFLARAGEVACRAGAVPFASTVTGGWLDGRSLDAGYFYRNIREPVRLTDALDTMFEAGHTLLVELGPHPILRRGAAELARVRERAVTWVPTLARDGNDAERIAACVDALYLAGARAWPSVGGEGPVPRVPLEPVRHWNEGAAAFRRRTGADRTGHPHLQRTEGGSRGMVRAEIRLSAAEEPYLAEHRVQGVVVFPGAGQLELCASVLSTLAADGGSVEDVSFRLPIEVDEDGTDLVLEACGPDGDFVIASDRAGDRVVHTRGRLCRRGGPRPAETLELDALRARIGRGVAPAALFEDARVAGLELGPAFRGIASFCVDGRDALARIEPPPELSADLGRFLVHPALLDAAIQTAALGALSQTASEGRALGLYLPAGVRRFRVLRPHGSGPLWCFARRQSSDGDEIEVRAEVTDERGELVLLIDGLRLRHVRGTERGPRLRASHAFAFAEGAPLGAPGARAGVPGEIWAVLGAGTLARRVGAGLAADGVRIGSERDGALGGIVDLSSLDDGPLAARLARVSAAVARGARRLRMGVRPEDPESGAWMALARVIASEVPTCRVAVIALAGADEAEAADWLLSDEDGEIVLRDGSAVRSRLERVGPAAPPPPAALDRQDAKAVVTAPGQISSVGWVRAAAPEPGPREVVVDVEAVGLNFKDVVVAAALLPDRAWTHGLTAEELGLDFAGTVRAAGPESGLSPGDEVLGLARHCLGSFTVADARLVVRRPSGLPVAAAAALPTVGLTAVVALEELARVRPGETVLVQGGAGGVGRVAIQIAAALGATVIASAGSPERRALLHQLGVDHVVDSRSAGFLDEVMAATGGRGVDVVLNSLSGELLDQGLRCLAPFGRFVEIGKADLYDNRLVGLEGFGENRALFGLDINRWANLRREETGRLLAGVVERVAEGRLAVPPILELPFDRAAEALGALAHSRHSGKVVVRRCDEVPTVRASRLAVRGTVLVTGGTSGFGLAIARLLAERGAECVVLASRAGAVADADRAALDEIRALGARVELASVDVRDEASVQALVDAHREQLTGVVHAAMVLDDAPLGAHGRERFERVLGPKVDGVRHLHRATLGIELDLFVVVSSIAAALGTPGQAAYAAANGFLDAFAAHRRALGLRATSVAFGPLGDVGVVARASADDRRKILAHGVGELRVGEALALLEGAILEDVGHRVAANVDFDRVTARLGTRFAHLAEGAAPAAAEETALGRIAALPVAERPAAVSEHLAALAARLVGAEAVDVDVPLSRLGLDSLVGTELASRIQADLGVAVPLVRILRGPTVRELAAEVAPRVGTAAGTPHRWVRRSQIPEPAARLFCFLPLGGDPDAYDAWQEHLPPGLEVCTVELPLDLAQIDGVDAVREQLVTELRPLCTVPFALYGHSVGGWIALEVAPGLTAAGAEPRFVALGAVPTPELLRSILPSVDRSAGPQAIDDDHALHALRTLRVPDRVLDAPETRNRLLAATRRDLWLGARSWRARPAFGGDVLVVRGALDPLDTLGAAEVDALGLKCVASVELPAGHLFHQDPAVRERLATLVSRTFAAEVGR